MVRQQISHIILEIFCDYPSTKQVKPSHKSQTKPAKNTNPTNARQKRATTKAARYKTNDAPTNLSDDAEGKQSKLPANQQANRLVMRMGKSWHVKWPNVES
jgi:hypothetical protein